MHSPKILMFFGIILLIGLVVFLLVKPSQMQKKLHRNLTQQPSPTPESYADLTIPFLRSRSYMSSLGAREKLEDNDTYTTYLTSYQSDGLKINGLLTIPTGPVPKGGFPAIVFVHGYIPPKSYETNGQAYYRYVDYLASRGFVVFKIDLRGHANSEGRAEGAYYSSAYVIDTLNAYAALQKADFVNAKKIGIWGHSMGGNITLRAVASKPTVPALVIWAGAGYTYKDLADYKITDASFVPSQSNPTRKNARAELQKQYGPPDPSKPFWHEIAPSSYLEDFKGAVQLDHAEDDAVVSIHYSQDLDKLLSEAKVAHEFYVYPTGGHNISDENFFVAMDHTVAFFKKYLE